MTLLKKPEERKKRDAIPIIGDIELDEDMRAILKLPPKTRINDIINEEDYLIEQESMIAKTKWGRRKIMRSF